MRIRLVKKQTILDFTDKHPRSKSSFDLWLSLLKGADWFEPADIKSLYGTADFLGKGTNRVIFNIGGNNYRLICSYYFGKKNVHLYINWIGTHKEYTRICDKQQQYTIENY
ncbi:MAG: type II toxin-antitoxin system HigB family toxin [Saprospiraceae bacterium]|nr:type II toxin-antitoxin system HigB family toxin [Saprospiraceae bacterium]